MNENTSIAVAIIALAAMCVGIGFAGKGCNADDRRRDVQIEELRQKSFQVCVQAGRTADECKRGLP
jgi:hypothetical protein